MLCFISEWFISRALDLGKKIPGVFRHHLKKCEPCQEYLNCSTILTQKLNQDAIKYTKKDNKILNEKISSSLKLNREFKSSYRHHFIPIKVLTASLVLLIAVFGIILQTNLLNKKEKTDFGINHFPDYKMDEISLNHLFMQVESPIESEMKNLKQSIKSTRQFIHSCFDFKIPD